MRTMNWIRNGLLASASVAIAQAGFHLTLDIGSLKDAAEQDLSSGTVIVMVSTADDTFTPPEAGGTFAVVGDDEYVGSAAINDGDENILKIFAPDYGANWTKGDPIAVYFVPAAIGSNDVLAAGQAFGFYSKAIDDGEGDPWTLPEDGTLLTNLKMFTSDVDEIASPGVIPAAVGVASFQIGTAIQALVQPANVIASEDTPGTITVEWDGNVPGGGYRVERWRPGQTTWKVLGFAGEDASSFVDNAASGGETYTYRIFAINGFGTEESDSAPIDTEILTRLANISSRAIIGSDNKVLIMGFVVRGGDRLPILSRAAGPSLGEKFGIPNAVEDPSLALINGDVEIGANDDWFSDQGAEIEAAAATVAPDFPFATDSKDAAILTEVDSTVAWGAHTFVTNNLTNDGGLGLVEVYDLPEDNRIRFINLSSRAFIGTGNDILIGGFVVKGPGTVKLLIRGIGPRLGELWDLPGVLADPRITVFRGSEIIASNDNWVAGEVQSAFNATGAFQLSSGSKDAALVIELTQGVYTVHLGGNNNGTGIGLLEFYEIID